MGQNRFSLTRCLTGVVLGVCSSFSYVSKAQQTVQPAQAPVAYAPVVQAQTVSISADQVCDGMEKTDTSKNWSTAKQRIVERLRGQGDANVKVVITGDPSFEKCANYYDQKNNCSSAVTEMKKAVTDYEKKCAETKAGSDCTLAYAFCTAVDRQETVEADYSQLKRSADNLFRMASAQKFPGLNLPGFGGGENYRQSHCSTITYDTYTRRMEEVNRKMERLNSDLEKQRNDIAKEQEKAQETAAGKTKEQRAITEKLEQIESDRKVKNREAVAAQFKLENDARKALAQSQKDMFEAQAKLTDLYHQRAQFIASLSEAVITANCMAELDKVIDPFAKKFDGKVMSSGSTAGYVSNLSNTAKQDILRICYEGMIAKRAQTIDQYNSQIQMLKNSISGAQQDMQASQQALLQQKMDLIQIKFEGQQSDSQAGQRLQQEYFALAQQADQAQQTATQKIMNISNTLQTTQDSLNRAEDELLTLQRNKPAEGATASPTDLAALRIGIMDHTDDVEKRCHPEGSNREDIKKNKEKYFVLDKNEARDCVENADEDAGTCSVPSSKKRGQH